MIFLKLLGTWFVLFFPMLVFLGVLETSTPYNKRPPIWKFVVAYLQTMGIVGLTIGIFSALWFLWFS